MSDRDAKNAPAERPDPGPPAGSGSSGKVLVIGLLVFIGLAGVLLRWATDAVQANAPPYPERMPAPIAASALPDGESEGARLLQLHCVACHALPDPAQHPAGHWPRVLADMEQRIQSRIMRGAPLPSRTGWRTIEAYLQAHAADAATAALDPPAP